MMVMFMSQKTLYFSKFYTLEFIFFHILFWFMLLNFDNKGSYFWNFYYVLFIISSFIAIIISLRARICLYESYFSEKTIFTKKIRFSDIDYVLYKKKIISQDYIIYLKNKKKYKMFMALTKKDDEYFKKYLLTNNVKVIEKY